MTISDISMVSFGYSYYYVSHIKNKQQIHYNDHTIKSYSDDIKDLIDDFKKIKKIPTSELNYNGRFYTPILNGELKCASVNKRKDSANCLNVSISKIDTKNRKVVVIYPDQGQELWPNKYLLYSAKTNYNSLVLIKCKKNYYLNSVLNNFENIRKNPEHPFHNLMNKSSYKNVANIGMYPNETAILCSYCDFTINYNELTQETSNPINIIKLHKTFIDNMTTQETINCHKFSYCKYNLQIHNKNIDHYHLVNLDKLTISDILQDMDSQLTVYLDTNALYFGKFNLETLDQNHLQNTQDFNMEENITAETAF